MSKMTIGFLITARLKSKRLPNKIILEVYGRSLICYMIERIKAAKRIDKVIICTSTNSQDNPLEKIANSEGIFCYRGSEEDVLVRLYEAAIKYNVDYIVNITADCPLIDPLFIDRVVEEYEKTDADLIRFNRLPLGQGPSGIKVSALEKVCKIKEETETEVWGDYFTKSGIFYFHNPDIESHYFHPTLKTSLDYPEDYEFIKTIFSELYMPPRIFSLLDIINLVKKKPGLLLINSHCAEKCVEHIAKTAKPMRLKSILNS